MAYEVGSVLPLAINPPGVGLSGRKGELKSVNLGLNQVEARNVPSRSIQR